MAFQLPELPYALDDLEPHISRRTLALHHGKHHRGYVDKLNGLVEGTDWAERELREVVQETCGKPELASVFNNAAQVWNHSFFWLSMNPQGGGAPEGEMALRIEREFGDVESFRRNFREAALGQFGAGWAWLVLDAGMLRITTTSNADTPVAHGLQPLLAIDVWEHAYYLDHQNDRAAYVDAWLDNLVNWEFASVNFEDAGEGNWKANRYREVREAFAESGLGDRVQ
jgi:Fe-Mn family superoxide dismutase